MTTIAYDGFSVCSDSLFRAARGDSTYGPKTVQIRGAIIGFAGDWDAAVKYRRRLLSGEQTLRDFLLAGLDLEDRRDSGASTSIDIMVVTPQQIFYNGYNEFVELRGRNYHAIGCGAQFALSAMALDKTSRVGVEVASLLDSGTGGDIVEEWFTSADIAEAGRIEL